MSLVLYDCTTLHFEVEDEDQLRKVGMSKERRVDPQIQVGLLVDPPGSRWRCPVRGEHGRDQAPCSRSCAAFQERHQVSDMVVVADAGMLSAANLNAMEDAGFSFIVGSRISKAPYDLADHFERHGNSFTDGQILESTRVMGTGKAARTRRVVYHYSFDRHKRDDRAINAMIDQAEKIAAGQAPMRNARFVKVIGATDADRPGARRPRPAARRAEGLRHQPPPRHHDRCRGDRRLPRPVAGRAVVPDDQDRPPGPAGLPPPT